MKVTFENEGVSVSKTFTTEYIQDVCLIDLYNEFVKINELGAISRIKETDKLIKDLPFKEKEDVIVKMETMFPKLPEFVDEEIEECTSLPAPPILNGDPEIDSAGVKWDPKIHAKAKTKNKNGTWRLGNNRELPTIPASTPSLPTPQVIEEEPEVLSEENELTLNHLMSVINNKISKKLLTHAQLFEILKSLGISSHMEAVGKPDLISQIILSIELTAPEN